VKAVRGVGLARVLRAGADSASIVSRRGAGQPRLKVGSDRAKCRILDGSSNEFGAVDAQAHAFAVT
jgi:hypothetical protein